MVGMRDDEPQEYERPSDLEPSPRRAELRRPPATYYRRVALGTVVPGAGLLRTRWRLLGWMMLLGALAFAAYLVVRTLQGEALKAALDAAVNPKVLQWIGVAVMVGAVLWIGSIVLTAEESWPRIRHGRWARVAFAAAGCLLVAAPSALAVRYLEVQSSLINEVFSDGGVDVCRPRAHRARGEGPVGRRAAGQHPAHRLRRRQGPLGHAHRLDDGRQHQHQDR